MDLTQIRYFLTLARTLNFTRAAAECNVTQPAFSRGIQKLEETLGGSLFLRERGLTQLTDFGRAMMPLLRQTHEAAEAVRLRAEERRRQQDEVPLRIGLCAFLAMGPLHEPIRAVTEEVRGVRLELTRGLAATLYEGILQGTLDIIVGPMVRALPDRLHHWHLWTTGVAAMLPQRHPLAADPAPLPISSLRTEPMILLSLEKDAEDARSRMRARYGLDGPRRHSAASPDAMTEMVAAGLGWAMVPEGTIPPAGTAIRPLLAEPQIRFDVIMASVAGRPMNRAARQFHRRVLDRFAGMQAA